MSEQWLGLHNPERHEPYAGQFAGYAECLPVLGGCLAECGEDDPCRCCLAAEVETLRAQVQAVRDVLGDVSNVYAPSGVSPLVNVSLILEALDGAK